MWLIQKIENRLNWCIRKVKKYCNIAYSYFFGMERKNAQTNILPDSVYLKRLFWKKTGMVLNLRFPKTYDEKLQWLKLHDRNPKYTELVDKLEVKKHVANTIGEQYVIPLLGVWTRFEDVDTDALPERFVLKCTHDSGGVVICKDKKHLDLDKLCAFFSERLSENYYKYGREWSYKNVSPRIIAEEYMEELDSHSLLDYKIHCFHGKPAFIQCIGNRDFQNHTAAQKFYDLEWNALEWTFEEFAQFPYDIPRPETLDEMIECAAKLSHEMPYVRVDLYTISGKVYFGEYTFYPLSGMHPYKGQWSPTINKELGDMIQLPKKRVAGWRKRNF